MSGRDQIDGLRQAVATVVRAHVQADPTRPAAGLLVGRERPGRGLPRVTGAIPLATSDPGPVAWENAQPMPGDQPVGWYSSRPGAGVELRPADKRTDASIVLLIDAERRASAVFVRVGGRLVRLSRRRTAPTRSPLLALGVGAALGFAGWHLLF